MVGPSESSLRNEKENEGKETSGKDSDEIESPLPTKRARDFAHEDRGEKAPPNKAIFDAAMGRPRS